MRARESVSRCKCAKKVNVIKMNSSLLLLRAALRPVNASRFVPRRPRPKAISSTLFCCPQSTAASATLRFNFLSLSLSHRDCGVLGAGGGLEWGMSPFSSRLLLRAAALIKAARLSFLSCSRRLPLLPPSPSPAASAAAACFGAFYNNYSLGFVNISCRRCRTWLRFVRPPLLTASSASPSSCVRLSFMIQLSAARLLAPQRVQVFRRVVKIEASCKERQREIE